MNFTTRIGSKLLPFFAAFLCLFCTFSAHAAHHKPLEDEKFDAGRVIMEHVTDSHEWHIWGRGEHSIALPLPVILYTDKGLEVFMSGKFEHGDSTVHGKYYNYQVDEANHVVIIDADEKEDEAATSKIIDLSITKNVASLFFSALLLLFVFLTIAGTYVRNPNEAPKGLQSFVEPIIVFVRDEIAKPSIGEKKYEKFMPYLLTIFFFIWFNNMLGMIPILPGGANLTGNTAVTGTLALFTFIIVSLNGNRNYWHHILAMPGVPKPILLILTPIEIMGVFLRPLVLMIRLFANISAGHIVALAIFCLIFIFGEERPPLGYGVGVFSVIFNALMGLLDLLVALLQAYVFAMLSALYIGAAVEEPHIHKESVI